MHLFSHTLQICYTHGPHRSAPVTVQGDVNFHLPGLAAATVFMNTTWRNSGVYTYLIQPTNKSCFNALIALRNNAFLT
jgi:hypothetical protein